MEPFGSAMANVFRGEGHGFVFVFRSFFCYLHVPSKSYDTSIIHDFHNGGRRADLETILHANEATKASRKT